MWSKISFQGTPISKSKIWKRFARLHTDSDAQEAIPNVQVGGKRKGTVGEDCEETDTERGRRRKVNDEARIINSTAATGVQSRRQP